MRLLGELFGKATCEVGHRKFLGLLADCAEQGQVLCRQMDSGRKLRPPNMRSEVVCQSSGHKGCDE